MSPWLSDLFLRSQTDERLVTLASAGQERAFSMIVERYRRSLHEYAHRFGAESAEDLVQQTFLCAYSALQSGTEVRHLRGWLYQILRHLAARPGASSACDAELTDAQAVTESAQETAERHMLALDALTAISRLPEHQHWALLQTAIHGRSRIEIADGMGLSEGAVRQLVHRARSAVRTAVTAVTPLPLTRWLAAMPSGSADLSGVAAGSSRLPEMAFGAGAAPAAGLVVKVGALIASGVVATSVIVVTSPHAGRASARERGSRFGVQVAKVTANGSEGRDVASPHAAGTLAGLGRETGAGHRQDLSHVRGAAGIRISGDGSGGRLGGSGGGPRPSATGQGSSPGGDGGQSGSTSGDGGSGQGGTSDGGTTSSDGGRSSGGGSGDGGGSSSGSHGGSSGGGGDRISSTGTGTSGSSDGGTSGSSGDSTNSGTAGSDGGTSGGSGSLSTDGSGSSDSAGAFATTGSSSGHDSSGSSSVSGSDGSGR